MPLQVLVKNKMEHMITTRIALNADIEDFNSILTEWKA